mgnify:CR=1 FL=1
MSSVVFATEVDIKKIKLEISLIKEIKPDAYLEKIKDIRQSIDQYIEYKTRVCKGEFSAVVFIGNENLADERPETQKIKLTQDEKKACLRELQFLQLDLIENIFIARKKYLTFLHVNKLNELEKFHKQLVQKLKRKFK